jgi:hypothetical protein
MKKLLPSYHSKSKGVALIIIPAIVFVVSFYNTDCTLAAPDSCVLIVSAQIVSPGSFYRAGDMLDPGYGTLCSPADNYGFRLRVNSVDGNGGVTAVTVIAGIGYSVPPSNPIRFGGSPTGTGFTANCIFN